MRFVATIAKQATNQMARFPIQFFFMNCVTATDKSLEKHSLYNGAIGAVAGAVSMLPTLPQDTVQTRMQGEDAKKICKNALDCAAQIYKQIGLGSFMLELCQE